MKRKKRILLLCFLFITSALYAQYEFLQDGHYYRDGLDHPYVYYFDHYKDQTYEFYAPNKITFGEWEDHNNYIWKEKDGTYTIDDSSGIPFLNIQWNDKSNERFLMLANEDFMLLYNSDNEPFFCGNHYYYYHEEYTARLYHMNPNKLVNVKATASLVEGGINYSPTPERLGLKLNSAWAVRGGINERLLIKPDLNFQWDDRIYISTGYVAYSKPHLYKENSRPKRIRIHKDMYPYPSVIIGEYELKDTPNFQDIILPEGYFQDIQIEILEVYPGTKYNDLCINSIITFIYWK
jgi:hypothetical protein